MISFFSLINDVLPTMPCFRKSHLSRIVLRTLPSFFCFSYYLRGRLCEELNAHTFTIVFSNTTIVLVDVRGRIEACLARIAAGAVDESRSA